MKRRGFDNAHMSRGLKWVLLSTACTMVLAACERPPEEQDHTWQNSSPSGRQQISSQTVPLEKRVASATTTTTTTTTVPVQYRLVHPSQLNEPTVKPDQSEVTKKEGKVVYRLVPGTPGDSKGTDNGSNEPAPSPAPEAPPTSAPAVPAPVTRKYLDVPERYISEQDFFTPAMMNPTIYYKPVLEETEQSCEEGTERPLYGPEGEEMFKVCRDTYYKCQMQGSCILVFPDTIAPLNYLNYDDINKKDLFFQFDLTQCPFSFGVRNICLDPYYSIAADPRLYDPGDVIFVPSVVGLKLPNGSVHHGFFIVRDIGDKIKGRGRFDFFTGFIPYSSQDNPFKKLDLGDKTKETKYYRVTGPVAERVRKQRGFPSLPESLLVGQSVETVSANLRQSPWKQVITPAPVK